jgi:hypothetical protein
MHFFSGVDSKIGGAVAAVTLIDAFARACN